MAKFGTIDIDVNVTGRVNGRALGWPMNKADNKAEILIYEDIGGGWLEGLTAKAFVEQLAALGDVTELDVRINSVGGSIFDAMAMYNALDRHPAQKNVFIDGIAASAASVIAMVASPKCLYIAENGRLMMHNAWTVEMGDKVAMRKAADRLEQSDVIIVGTYLKRATCGQQKIVDMMTAETWLTAQQSIDLGLADEIIPPRMPDGANKLDLTKFRNVPRELVEGREARGESQTDATAIDVQRRWAEVREREAA